APSGHSHSSSWLSSAVGRGAQRWHLPPCVPAATVASGFANQRSLVLPPASGAHSSCPATPCPKRFLSAASLLPYWRRQSSRFWSFLLSISEPWRAITKAI